MLNYINSFSLSTAEDRSKIVIHLGQNYPISFSQNEDSIQNELISSVILDADTALALCYSILNNLNEDTEVADEEDNANDEK